MQKNTGKSKMLLVKGIYCWHLLSLLLAARAWGWDVGSKTLLQQ